MQCYNPEDQHLNLYCHKNLKCHMTEQVTWYVESSEFNDHLIYQHRLRYRSGVTAPLHYFTHSFIYSFHSLPCDRSIASSKVSSPQNAI